MTLKEAIRELVKDLFTHNIRIGRVITGTVSGGFCDVTPIDSEDAQGNGATLKAVRIQANPGNGIMIIPADNSLVIIGEVAPFDYCILLFSQITSIQWLDGSRGGLVDAGEIKAQLDKTNKVINDLIHALTTWTPVSGDGGAALKSAAISALGTDVVGDFTNISNPNITHGNP